MTEITTSADAGTDSLTIPPKVDSVTDAAGKRLAEEAEKKKQDDAGTMAPDIQSIVVGSDDDDPYDYSKVLPAEKEAKTPELAGDYDSRPVEDLARRHIAYLLIGLLWLVTSAVFILLCFGTVGVTDIKEFAVLLGPIVTLVSAATGFYYGTKTK